MPLRPSRDLQPLKTSLQQFTICGFFITEFFKCTTQYNNPSGKVFDDAFTPWFFKDLPHATSFPHYLFLHSFLVRCFPTTAKQTIPKLRKPSLFKNHSLSGQSHCFCSLDGNDFQSSTSKLVLLWCANHWHCHHLFLLEGSETKCGGSAPLVLALAWNGCFRCNTTIKLSSDGLQIRH